MKKILLLFLVIQLFSANGFAEELSKIPSLFIHFEHHLIHEKNQSFTDFIANHYGGNSHDNEADHEHLPLKHCADHCIHQTMVQAAPEYFYCNFYYTTLKTSHVINYKTQATASFSGSIFQPPRLA